MGGETYFWISVLIVGVFVFWGFFCLGFLFLCVCVFCFSQSQVEVVWMKHIGGSKKGCSKAACFYFPKTFSRLIFPKLLFVYGFLCAIAVCIFCLFLPKIELSCSKCSFYAVFIHLEALCVLLGMIFRAEKTWFWWGNWSLCPAPLGSCHPVPSRGERSLLCCPK